MRRPESDPSLDALQPVLARQTPVILEASSQREIERALDLAKEFNLRAIIAGGDEASGMRIDRVSGSRPRRNTQDREGEQ